MPKPSLSGAFQGGLQGGTLGGTIGGPWGAGIGALLGSIGGLFGLGASDKGTPDSFTSEQKKLIDPLYGAFNELNPQGISALQGLLNYQPEGLEDMQRPALDQFQNQIVPGILERFSGLGAARSSALNQTLGEAAKGLGTNLAALRAQQQQGAAGIRGNALQQLLGMNQFLLRTPYQEGRQSSPGLWEQLAPITGQLLGNYLSSFNGGGGSSLPSLQGAFGSQLPSYGG